MWIGLMLAADGYQQENTSNALRTATVNVGARRFLMHGLENTWISHARETAIAGFLITGGRFTERRRYGNYRNGSTSAGRIAAFAAGIGLAAGIEFRR